MHILKHKYLHTSPAYSNYTLLWVEPLLYIYPIYVSLSVDVLLTRADERGSSRCIMPSSSDRYRYKAQPFSFKSYSMFAHMHTSVFFVASSPLVLSHL